MSATCIDYDIATFELRIFLDAVSATCQLILGMLANQRRILRVEVDHGVLCRQLRQCRAYGSKDQFGLHDDRLADDLARDFKRQRKYLISEHPFDVRDAGIETGNGLPQIDGKFPGFFARCFLARLEPVNPTGLESSPIPLLSGRFPQDRDAGLTMFGLGQVCPRRQLPGVHGLADYAVDIAEIGHIPRLPCVVPGFGWRRENIHLP